MSIDWKRKFTSRKFLAAVAGIVAGFAMVFGLDQNTISNVAGAVVSVASVVAYIITEGKVDAESVKQAAENVEDAVAAVTGTTAVVSRNTTIYDTAIAFPGGEVEDGNR